MTKRHAKGLTLLYIYPERTRNASSLAMLIITRAFISLIGYLSIKDLNTSINAFKPVTGKLILLPPAKARRP